MHNGTERVTVVAGKRPVLFVAPHGYDEYNTGTLALKLADLLEGYAVVNNGWKVAKSYNYARSEANCNDTKHCHEDVVREEFLDPIIDFKNRIKKKDPWGYFFNLHGIANNKVYPDLRVIVGWGETDHASSYTCKEWMKDLLIYELETVGWDVYEASQSSGYAASTKSNLTQLFRKYYPESYFYGMQLELVRDIRENKLLDVTAEFLASAVEQVITQSYWRKPTNYDVKIF